MSQKLISRSEDLQKLQNEGYNIELANGYIALHGIPYLDSLGAIKYASLVSTLCLQGEKTTRPNPHTIYFTGDYPFTIDGKPITAIKHQETRQRLFNDVQSKHSFSNKPERGYYNDYFEKFKTYINIISSHAMVLDETVTAQNFAPVIDSDSSPFNYMDTNSSRSNIVRINDNFISQKIGIIGIGGTGSYVLDMVAKTPVAEIHLFDGDDFLQHNAFRAPGAPSLSVLESRANKCDYFMSLYSNMHKHIYSHNYFLESDSLSELDNLDHIFICIDNGSSKKEIIEYLVTHHKSFTDLGIGVNVIDSSLQGTLRATTCRENQYNHIDQRISYSDNGNDEYSTNIQISELNALNAIMGVIQWKKNIGFYSSDRPSLSSIYLTNTEVMIDENIT